MIKNCRNFAAYTECLIINYKSHENTMLDIDKVEAIILTLISGILSYFRPIEGTIYSIGVVFAFNFLAGVLADRIENGKGFSMKKAWMCVVQAGLFFLFCASVYATGELNGNHSGAIYCVSSICYIIYYAFGCNIARNLRSCFVEGTPPWVVFDIIYSTLSLEMVKKLPWLGKYVKEQKRSETIKRKRTNESS